MSFSFYAELLTGVVRSMKHEPVYHRRSVVLCIIFGRSQENMTTAEISVRGSLGDLSIFLKVRCEARICVLEFSIFSGS